MDSPLNRAHQQERKAEQLILSKNYLAAITCYEIAAGHITEAMKATSATQALVSMQLQYEDHLRKQRILKEKMTQQAQAEKHSQQSGLNGVQQKQNSEAKPNGNEEQDINITEAKNNLRESSSIKSDISFSSSLSSSQIVITQTESITTRGDAQNLSVEDLQMQMLSLTQALEDCNRENNHLRSIIVKFKDVLHTQFGLSDEQIEDILISQDKVE